jgi:predicted oxidoreductase
LDHLASTAEGQRLNDPDAGDPVLVELNATRDALTGITTRLDTIGLRLAEGCG